MIYTAVSGSLHYFAAVEGWRLLCTNFPLTFEYSTVGGNVVKSTFLAAVRGAVLMVVAAVWMSPPPALAQALYGTVTGQVVDGSGAAIPGVTVSVTNEGTGLEVNGLTDDSGAYTIRNLQPGRYTVKATLQGFKEFQQTGVPVDPNNVVRINAQLEVGALSEMITVTTDAALLKTDKADVSVNLKPEEVVNLPLNQYRNYQGLMNLVPGATPVNFQNAQTDTPGRALTTNVNGTNRNNNVTRIDGAASINVWLPHHAGYIAPVETVDTVNISTNSFDASQGMTGGAAVSVQTKSGTNELRGSAFFFRNQDEFNARQAYFSAADNPNSSVNILGGTVGGPIRRNKLFFFGGWERNLEKNSRIDIYTVPTARMRAGDFSEVVGAEPRLPDLRSGHRQSDDRCRPYRVSRRRRAGRPDQPDFQGGAGLLPAAQRRRHQQRAAEQLRSGPLPRSDARQLRRQVQLEPDLRQPDLGQVLAHGRQRAWTCSTCPSTSRAAATPSSTCGASAPPTPSARR